MRTAYLGTTDFAATVLCRLAASPHRPELVVTRPDRPRGRGRKLQSPPVGDAARELGIELAQPDDVNGEQARARIDAAAPEALCICAFGALIREPLLSSRPWFNVHPSLLPRWRGAAPVERAIEAGDAETGVSIMQLAAELDSGPVYQQRAEPIRPDDDYGALAARLAVMGGEVLVEALDADTEAVSQPAEGATYAEKIERDERRLDPDRTADELARRVRALTPHIGVFVEADRERLGVRRATPATDVPIPAPGELASENGRLLYGTRGGALDLLEVQPAGGRTMDAQAYLRGRVRRGGQDASDG